MSSAASRGEGCISVDGELFAPHEACISALDVGLLLGDGVFESLRATDGQPYLFDHHLRRLLDACAACELQDVPPAPLLATQVRGTLARAALADAYVRITVTRGRGGIGLAPPVGPPSIIIAALPISPLALDDAIAVALLPTEPRARDAFKSTSWQHAVLARRRVERAGAAEGIYCSEHGAVLEAVSSNVFVVLDGTLRTPPEALCLPGITRRRVLELARERGIVAEEAPVHLDVVSRADELFLTNAVAGLRAVSCIDGVPVGAGAPGELTATLHALYEADRRAVVATAT